MEDGEERTMVWLNEPVTVEGSDPPLDVYILPRDTTGWMEGIELVEGERLRDCMVVISGIRETLLPAKFQPIRVRLGGVLIRGPDFRLNTFLNSRVLRRMKLKPHRLEKLRELSGGTFS